MSYKISTFILKIKFLIISILFFILFLPLQAQTEKEINEQVQFWTSINSTMRFSDHWGAMGDFHVRRNNFMKDPSFYFLRVGGVYWINDKISFAGGGAALWLATTTSETSNFALEKRLFQQLLWRSINGKTKFLQRVRNEQRWHEVLNEDGSVNRIRFSNRVRFLFSATIKVFENEKLPRLVIADEILFHFGEEIVYNTFDQNRFFIGINQRINKNLVFDLGYMAVLQQKYSGYQYDLNHTIRFFFYYSPDFRKKKEKELPHYPVSGSE